MLQLAVIQNHIENTNNTGDGYTDNKRCIQPVPDSKRIEDKGKTEHTEKQPGRKPVSYTHLDVYKRQMAVLPT